jgi:hypothetical protein
VGFLVGFEDDRFQGTILHKSPTITHISRSISTKGKLDQAVAKRVRVIVLCRSSYIYSRFGQQHYSSGGERVRGIKSFHPGNTKEAACVRANRRSHRQRGRQDGGRTHCILFRSSQNQCVRKRPAAPYFLLPARARTGAPDKPWPGWLATLGPRIIKIVHTPRRGIIYI